MREGARRRSRCGRPPASSRSLVHLTNLIEVADARALFVEPHGVPRGLPKLLAGRSGEQRDGQSVCRLHGGVSNTISFFHAPVHSQAHICGTVFREGSLICPHCRSRVFPPPLPLDEIDPRHDIPPLVAPSQLYPTVMRRVEVRKVVRLKELVREFRE